MTKSISNSNTKKIFFTNKHNGKSKTKVKTKTNKTRKAFKSVYTKEEYNGVVSM